MAIKMFYSYLLQRNSTLHLISKIAAKSQTKLQNATVPLDHEGLKHQPRLVARTIQRTLGNTLPSHADLTTATRISAILLIFIVIWLCLSYFIARTILRQAREGQQNEEIIAPRARVVRNTQAVYRSTRSYGTLDNVVQDDCIESQLYQYSDLGPIDTPPSYVPSPGLFKNLSVSQ
ncbi:hypothetical protein BP6252_05648 [Coleophoma cylindrospora]|uniref:Uncharacterized protein n=1 Tax=Coleophoma cylindrospora TaxID=1849047 RepID=A0A3D8RUB3_9HELO|nr:hypothetical protein BP6252_05648 [Coleophoma cylindrospora]